MSCLHAFCFLVVLQFIPGVERGGRKAQRVERQGRKAQRVERRGRKAQRVEKRDIFLFNILQALTIDYHNNSLD